MKLVHHNIFIRYFRRMGCLLWLWGAISCKEVQKLTDIVVRPTEREKYARHFEGTDTLYLAWNTAFGKAKIDSLTVTLPYVERGQFGKVEKPMAYQYTVYVPEGRELLISLSTQDVPGKAFVDIFASPVEEGSLLSGMVSHNSPIVFPVPQTGAYHVILQPPLGLSAPFLLEMGTRPRYGFPVSNATDRAIQSFWGAEREGGLRAHQGVDIFAPRGTPVLSSVDGRVSSTGNRGLGGKQVWLRDGLTGKSLYYCHLDSIAVRSWTRINRGDTIGFVGNTGNARATAPHLHFGVYGSGGAVDPLPFIQREKEVEAQLPVPPAQGRIASPKANLRMGPKTSWDIVGTLAQGDTLQILGNTKDWFHVVTKGNFRGFVHRSLVGKLE